MDEAGIWQTILTGVNIKTTSLSGVKASKGTGMDANGVMRAIFDQANGAIRVIAVA